jgi:GrpB-like predicted nucleotidyltransferase (UPF0157 family)
MNQSGKTLAEMTREELWHLFPISLAEYNPRWKEWYAEENRLLENSLPADRITAIQHVGSTSLGTIHAKPIVDIMVETKSPDDFPVIRNILLNAGYRLMSEDDGRMSFNKGYTEQGFADKVFHLHLRKAGDNDELYFRDYLIEHPGIADEYESLKLSLWRKYEFDRDAYTTAKTDFIQEHTRAARAEYKDRYCR